MDVRLKGRRCVGEAERHDHVFEQAIPGLEGRLPFISFLNSNIVIAPSYIKFGEIPGSLEASHNIRYQWEGVSVFDHDLVQLSVVLYETKLPSFFLIKKTGEDRGDLDGRI